MPGWVNVANALTLLRLLLVPWIVEAIARGEHLLGVILFVVAAWTDLFDGLAARSLGKVTGFGARLDPIADKCLLSGVFLALAFAGSIPWWVVAVVFGRDIAILLGAVLLMRRTTVRDFPPSIWGKLSTFTQIVTVVSWMSANAFPSAFTSGFAAFMLWPCVTITIWSGAHYAWRAGRLWRRQRAEPGPVGAP